VSRPLDRTASLPELGAVDRENGEFWAKNAFTMIGEGNNVSAYERNRVFLNTGDGKNFLDASFASAADIDSDSRSVIVADFDQDGWPDLLVGSVGGGPLRLFLNNSARDNHRIVVKLVGTSSNRHAVGSRVVVECGEDRIIRDLFKANGHHDQSPGTLLVGVGKAEEVDRLVVRWPTGKKQVFTNLPVDSRIELTEGEDAAAIESLDGLGELVRNGDR
jgi:hypothetical protein